MARAKQYFTFQNQQVLNDDGNSLLIERITEQFVDDFDIIAIEIVGTATSGETFFEVQVTPNGNFYPIAGVRISDYSISTNSTGVNETWTFDVAAYYSFRTRVANILGGYLTVVGKASKYI